MNRYSVAPIGGWYGHADQTTEMAGFAARATEGNRAAGNTATDPHLGPYTPRGATLRAAIELASDVEGLRLVLASAIGDCYRVRVGDDGLTVELWRR